MGPGRVRVRAAQAAHFLMGDVTGKDRLRTGRLIATVAVVLCVVSGAATISLATPSKADLHNAEARLNTLNRQMSSLVKQYDQAQTKLQQTEVSLNQARSDVERAAAALAQAEA